MRSAKEKGGAVAPEEEVPRRSAPKGRKKKRKRDSDDDDDDDDDNDLDYNPSLEEKKQAHRFKRPKSQAATKFASQLNIYVPRTSLDTGIRGVSLSSQSPEQNRLNETMSHDVATSTKGQLPMVSPMPQPYRVDRFDFRYFTSPFVTTTSGPMLRDVMNTRTADACREERLTGRPNTECERQEKQKFISSNADVFREYSLRSNSSPGSPTADCQRRGKQKKFVSSNGIGCQKYTLRSSSSSDTNCKSQESQESQE